MLLSIMENSIEIEDFKKAYLEDPRLEEQEDNLRFKKDNQGIILYNGRIYILTKHRLDTICREYKLPILGGYQGITKIYTRLKEIYNFPGIYNYIKKEVIAKYNIYNKKRNFRYIPYKKLQPLLILDRHQLSISIDFIVKLSILRILGSNDEFDSIFIIVDRKGKTVYFVLYREVMNAEKFISIFYQTVTSRYRIPVEIILD